MESERESAWQSDEERMVQQGDQHVQRPRGIRETDTVGKSYAIWLSQMEMFGLEA